ncbi:MAG: hypothetical protein NT069_27650 [Planctomycetota bacterium]|nr:hypothetical protein [Planctomycetota bacterium]
MLRRPAAAFLVLFCVTVVATEVPRRGDKLPPLPGKAPVFALITKVDASQETFNFILLYDELINSEKVVVDASGRVVKKSSDSVMTNRFEEQADRSFKGTVISTGDGRIIPRERVWKELAGKIVIFCDDFDGLHPVYRKLLADDAWIVEIEKQGGLRKGDKGTGPLILPK